MVRPVTTGLAGALSPYSNALTTWGTRWLFALAFAVGLACLVLRARRFVHRLRVDADARRALGVAVALFAGALLLRLLVPERLHYTFNDEYEYLDHAQRLWTTGEYRLWTGPPAGVALWSVAFALFGTWSAVAFAVTIVLASLTPPALDWLLRLLGVERAVALCAAVLLALAPLHVKHAASASLEIASLLVVLVLLGTFLEELRAPSRLGAIAFATSLFLALTVRLENWALPLVLAVVAWLWRREVRRPPLGHVVIVVLAVVLAALYLPGLLDAPIRYVAWWKSQLPAGQLLLVNLGFWFGGDVGLRKVPLLLALVGLAAALRRSPRATVVWLVFALVYSLLFVGYGLNIGWREEAHQPPPWGVRSAGHDMFRFDLLLLPVAVLLLASGIVALARAARALVRGDGAAARWPRRTRLGAVAAGAAVLVALLAWRGEWRSYHPLEFVASSYNRGFEIKELRFLRDALASAPRDARLYVLPPTEGVFVDGIAVRPLARLPDEQARAAGPAYVYVNGRQLAVPDLRRVFDAASGRFALTEVARRADQGDRFFLLAVASAGA